MKTRSFFKSVIKRLYVKFIKLIYRNLIVVRVDGGICSQMNFYLIGKCFEENGYRVAYDLSWYCDYGMDKNGEQVRNFDLLSLFPELKFKVIKNSFIMKGFRKTAIKEDTELVKMDKWIKYKAPVYLNRYYRIDPDLFVKLFVRYFHLEAERILDEKNLNLYNEIKSNDSVAVHIRRGDLANYDPYYGNPCSIGYFEKSLNYIITNYAPNSYVYVFSDDPCWCKANVLSVFSEIVGDGNKCLVVDINDASKGYMDLALISASSYIITSKGSLGKFGAFLGGEKKVIVLNGEDKSFCGVNKNAVIIYDK